MYLTILRESNKLQPHEQTKKRNRNGEEANPRQLLKGRATNDPAAASPMLLQLVEAAHHSGIRGGKMADDPIRQLHLPWAGTGSLWTRALRWMSASRLSC